MIAGRCARDRRRAWRPRRARSRPSAARRRTSGPAAARSSRTSRSRARGARIVAPGMSQAIASSEISSSEPLPSISVEAGGHARRSAASAALQVVAALAGIAVERHARRAARPARVCSAAGRRYGFSIASSLTRPRRVLHGVGVHGLHIGADAASRARRVSSVAVIGGWFGVTGCSDSCCAAPPRARAAPACRPRSCRRCATVRFDRGSAPSRARACGR